MKYLMKRFIFVILLMAPLVNSNCINRENCPNCIETADQVFLINCRMPGFVDRYHFRYKPYEFMNIFCSNYPIRYVFDLIDKNKLTSFRKIRIEFCQFSEEEPHEDVIKHLIDENVTELVFIYTSKLHKKNYANFEQLTKLISAYNNITDESVNLLHNLTNLEFLDLSHNSFTKLQAGFLDLANLTAVDLSHNKLVTLEPGLFRRLQRLVSLRLEFNKLTNLSSTIFQSLESLVSLNLAGNHLKQLPSSIFESLRALTFIDISKNSFVDGGIPQDVFRNNNALETAFFTHNAETLQSLPDRMFAELAKLRTVSLNNNGFTKLPENLFTGSRSLENITLSDNKIREIPADIFKDCRKIITLSLKGNMISHLPDMFKVVSTLRKLDVSHNQLREFNTKFVEKLTSLRVLDLSNNRIEKINEDGNCFQFCDDDPFWSRSNCSAWPKKNGGRLWFCVLFIEQIYLNDNRLEHVPSAWLLSEKLNTLTLHNNRIKNITMKDFTFFRGNTQITYANNQIETISFADYETFPMFAKRLELVIGKNPINCDCRIHDFLKFRDSKIQKLPIVLDLQGTYCHEPEDLSSTRIAELDRSILKCLVEVPIGLNAICPEKCQCWKIPENQIYRIDCRYKNLIEAPEHLQSPEGLRIELLLDENRIRKMPLMTRPGYDYVVKLTLSGNMIEDVCLDGLSNNLEILTLDSNRLRNLDPQVLTFLKDSTKLRHLELHGNPWVCNCETVDLLKFIVATSSKFQDLQNVTCESLEYPIFQMMLEDFCPVVAGSIIMVGISIALLGILIGIVAAMYYSYQHEIKVWLYTKQWCLWFITEDEIDKDKQFDAFVSFSHMDHDLVAGTLVPKLEEDPYHYRLCVHYRNWIPGESIPTQIFNSVENSKRTIIVLSQNFLDSVWSRLEFRTAHEQALSEGRARVIIVLLGDIGPADNLDPELKAYLKLNTYVRWGDPWFWEKLKYALPHSSNLQRKDWRGVTSHIELNESIL